MTQSCYVSCVSVYLEVLWSCCHDETSLNYPSVRDLVSHVYFIPCRIRHYIMKDPSRCTVHGITGHTHVQRVWSQQIQRDFCATIGDCLSWDVSLAVKNISGTNHPQDATLQGQKLGTKRTRDFRSRKIPTRIDSSGTIRHATMTL
jgi:hypothetical protein